MPLLMAAAIIWSISIANRVVFSFFAATGLFLAIYLIFGSSSFSRLIPLPVQARYFEVLIPFLAVATAGVVAHYQTIWQSRRREFLASIVISVVFGLASVPAIIIHAGDYAFSSLGKNCAIAIRALKHADPNQAIHVSPQLHSVLETFIRPDEYIQLKVIPDKGKLQPGFYLLHSIKDMKIQSEWVNNVLAQSTYLILNEGHRTFSRILPVFESDGCTVKHLD